MGAISGAGRASSLKHIVAALQRMTAAGTKRTFYACRRMSVMQRTSPQRPILTRSRYRGKVHLFTSRVCHWRDVDGLSVHFREKTRSPALILYLRANLSGWKHSDATEDVIMIKRPSFPPPCSFPSLWWLTCLAVAPAFLTIGNGAVAQQRYNTPDAAVTALVGAVRVGTPALLMRVLGPGSDEVVSSGDPVADAFARKRLLDAYNIRHQIVREGKDNAVLVVGQEEWPLPIPLVRLNNTWRFDAQIARREIVFRRIGRNEQGAIQVCLLYVNAQREYAKKGFAGEGVYAQRLLSQPGEKDGLYWPALSGEDASPLAELAAAAAAEGYPITDQRNPYHGYHYRILMRQGPNAPGGEIDYVVRGNMIGGFALVAYPAQYRISGLMTFLVSHHGHIYEKDLGSRTAAIASGMTSFDPDHTWRRVTQAVQSASGP